jgi:hypothetical protein
MDWFWIKKRRKEKQENEVLEKSIKNQTTKYLLDRYLYIERMLCYSIDYESRENFERESQYLLKELDERKHIYLNSCGCVMFKNVENLINS